MVAAGSLRWFDQLPCAVTVCDRNYTILYLNDRAAEVNAKDGGKELIGKNMIDCHPPEAQEKLRRVMASGQPNVYTIEKNGVRKMIYQCHWKEGGHLAGLLEVTFELPPNVPHFVRT
ncbi:MAG: PAS domain-containing protein [Thermoplasmata archaeon]